VAKHKPIPNISLREAREQRMLNQQEVAERIGTTSGTVVRWEGGKTFPSAYYRQKLCDFFDKSPEELGLLRERYQDSSDEDNKADLAQPPTGHEQEQNALATVASLNLEMAVSIASQQPASPNQPSQEQQLMPLPPLGFVPKYKVPISIFSLLVVVVVLAAFIIPTYLQKPPAEINPVDITPADLATISPTRRDTFTDSYALHWVTPPGYDAIRSCQFTPAIGGLHTIDRDNWPLALCFEKAIRLTPPYAVQVAVTFPPDKNDTQAHGAGIVIAASDPSSDNGPMKRFRIGDDQSYDIYAKSNDIAHTGRLDVCPSLTDPHAQSTLHNDYNALTSPDIVPGTGTTNTITVVVGAHIMVLYVNGQKLQTACDASSNVGMIGLFGDSPWKKEFTEADFNNLTIWTKFTHT
jgi:Predicted transcriptional regulators